MMKLSIVVKDVKLWQNLKKKRNETIKVNILYKILFNQAY